MKKAIGIVLGFAVVGGSLGACSTDNSKPHGTDYNSNLRVHHITVDGKAVTCIESTSSGGLSCNFS